MALMTGKPPYLTSSSFNLFNNYADYLTRRFEHCFLDTVFEKPTSMHCKSHVLRPHKARPLTSVWAQQVAQRYGFLTPGKYPVTVGILTFNTQSSGSMSTGLSAIQGDAQAYAQHAGFPMPQISAVSADGSVLAYRGNPQGADGEDALDVQQILGATQGRVNIRLYCAANSGPGGTAIMNLASKENFVCAFTSSWGLAERQWSAGDRDGMNAGAALLLSKGCPCFAASGDAGSGDGLSGNNADFPASSLYWIACGGTSLASGTETAWGYGGGGYSSLYPRPSWQSGLFTNSGRGEPDLAGNADANSGYPVCIGGQWVTLGGTSAVAPLFAAGVACVVSNTGQRVPVNFPAWLYANRALCQDILTGSNGAFSARAGWDECTGCGTPTARLWAALIAQATTPPTSPPTSPPPTPVTTLVPATIKAYDKAGNQLWVMQAA